MKTQVTQIQRTMGWERTVGSQPAFPPAPKQAEMQLFAPDRCLLLTDLYLWNSYYHLPAHLFSDSLSLFFLYLALEETITQVQFKPSLPYDFKRRSFSASSRAHFPTFSRYQSCHPPPLSSPKRSISSCVLTGAAAEHRIILSLTKYSHLWTLAWSLLFYHQQDKRVRSLIWNNAN